MKHVLLKILILLVGLPGYHLVAQTFKGISPKLKLVIENSISSKNPMLIGLYFKGAPYLSNRLSKSNPEKMYYSFSDFDCVTYVENVLALYYSEGANAKFIKNLINIRYDDTVSYENRNHYLTKGLQKMVALNILSPINNQFNSKLIQKNVNYLSKHVSSHNINMARIINIEKSISQKNMYYFDSTKDLKINDLIKNGDVIAFVSSRNDLDFQHVGFVHIKNNKKYILHASQEKKIVCISDVTIDQYIFKNKKITGFQIYRPKI
jgi:hypothetical protein